MKILVTTMAIKEVEVDDKFAVLGVENENYIPYPQNEPLFDELEKFLYIKEGFKFENDYTKEEVMKEGKPFVITIANAENEEDVLFEA